MIRRLPVSFNLLLMTSLLLISGCGDESVTAVGIDSITVDPASVSLLPGETVSLSATPRDATGSVLAERPVDWSSSEPSVASVDGSGAVQAHAEGVTEIRAASGGVSGTATVTVGVTPTILLSRDEVEFSASAGEPPTSPVEIAIANAGGGTLSGLRVEVAYQDADGWLQVVLQSSSAPSSVELQAVPGSLAPGSYAAEVHVIGNGASNSPRTIDVEFVVLETGAQIRVSPEAVGFSSSEGQALPSAQSVDVENAGGGELSGLGLELIYVSGGSAGWLTAELQDGTAPTEIVLRVDPAGLEPGVYDAHVRVISPDAPQSDAVVAVRYRFGDPPPQFDLTPAVVARTMEEGGTIPDSASIAVDNAGSGTLGSISFEVEFHGSADGWMTASLMSSTAPTSLGVEFAQTATDLAPGTYRADVIVESDDAINSPASAEVRLEVLPRPSLENSTVTAAPAAIQADGSSTSTVTVQLVDPRGVPLAFGGDDVTMSTSAGSLSGVIDLGDGRYRSTLTSSTQPGVATITARLRGETIEDEATVEFTANAPPDAGQSDVSASPGTIAIGGTSTIEVQLRTADGSRVTRSGDHVFLTTTRGSLSPVGGRTTNGVFRSTLTANSIGTATVTAYLGENATGEQIGTATVLMISVSGDDEPDAGQSSVTVDPDTIQVGGSATVRVQLRDSDGNEISGSGDDVFVATSLGEVSPTGGETESGVFETTFSSDESGTATITAYLGSDAQGEVIGEVAVRVESGDADASESDVAASSESISPGGSVAIEVQLRDSEGNDVTRGGDPVFVGTTLGTVDPSSGETDDDGRFETTFSSSETGTATVTAYLGNDAQGQEIASTTITVDGEADPDPGQSSITADPLRISTAGDASTIRVQLRDSAGNDLTTSGIAIFLTATRGSHTPGTLSPDRGQTTDGVFEAQYTSDVTGGVDITAYLGDDASGPMIGLVSLNVSPGEEEATGGGLEEALEPSIGPGGN